MAGANMAARLSLPVANTSTRIAMNRMFSSSSYTLALPKTSRSTHSPNPELSAQFNPTKRLDPSIPENSGSQSRYPQAGPKPPRRPGVKPPPTLALPSSMLPPPPRVPLPMTLSKQTISKVSDAHGKTFDIYMNSLNHRNEEPTLDDLDALRPPPSTLRAAFQGVIGSGRALLPPEHPLYLAIEQLGAQEATSGGGPKGNRTVVAGSRNAKKLEYQALYAATEGMVARSFTVAQLKAFGKETRAQKGNKKSGLPPDRATSKPRIIHDIMNMRWGMMHPKIVEEHMTDRDKIIERSYQVSPSEFFIFLGRDGEDVLHLAKELNMRIDADRKATESLSSNGPTTRPCFIIRASGTKLNHEKLKKHIENQRDAMTIRIVKLPIGPALSPSLLQSISRVAGAFVENIDPKFASLHDDGTSAASVSITARSPRSAYTAERLVQRAAMEAAHRSQLSLFALLKDGKSSISTTDEGQDSEYGADRYALYPFGAQGFRVRTVQQTNLAPQPSPNDATQIPLTSTALDMHNYDKDDAFILTGEELPATDAPKAIVQGAEKVTARNVRGEVVDLRQHILGNDNQGEIIITATFGHVVFKTEKPNILDPPLPEPVPSNSLLEWVDKYDSTARAFVQGQVPATPIPSDVTSIHRLQYRTIEGGNIINIDVKLPDNDTEPSAGETGNLGASSENHRSTDGLELTSATQSPAESVNEDHSTSNPEKDSKLTEKRGVGSTPSDSLAERAVDIVDKYSPVEENSSATELTPLPVEIMVGTETAFELILPKSTMDIYLQVSNMSPMERSTAPEAVDTYLDGLSKFFLTDIEMPQPDPPQYLEFNGQHYMLVKNTSARSGISTFAELPGECVVTSESSLDLENNTPTRFTQLTHRSKISEKGWGDFIEACETLASQPYERSTELRVSPT